MAFGFLFLIPLVIAVAGFIFLDTITVTELAWQVFAQAIVAGLSSWIIYSANTHDVEIWNGYVTGKEQVRVHCRHSYRCNCYTTCSGSGSSRSCSEHCSTCYEHFFDYDWEVYNSIKETIDIDTVDRQGLIEPPRWTAVKLGEPTSSEHWYTNYIKAAPDTLFRHHGLVEKYKGHLPKYPGEVFDYYRLNRLVLVNGAKVDDRKAWNAEISRVNAVLGDRKEVNMVVVLAKNLPSDYAQALEESWVGGKENDVVLVIGVNAANEPQWAKTLAWTLDERVKINLRDDIMSAGVVQMSTTIGALERNVDRFYKRKPMSDFEYLAASVTPTTTQWVVSMLIGFMVACGLTYMFHVNDFTSGGGRGYRSFTSNGLRYRIRPY